MHNLVTYAGSHILEKPKQIRRALNAAAGFADEERHARSCPMCHRNN